MKGLKSFVINLNLAQALDPGLRPLLHSGIIGAPVIRIVGHYYSTKLQTLMGGHPYYYFVEYQPDIEAALQDLRQREFEAGRYNPAQPFIQFPIRPDSPGPGAQHDSIFEAIEDAGEDGTRSILDIESVSDWPDFGVSSPLPEEELERYFGTIQPSKEMVSRNLKFLASVKRGHCVYITMFESGEPSELFFGGYSFD